MDARIHHPAPHQHGSGQDKQAERGAGLFHAHQAGVHALARCTGSRSLQLKPTMSGIGISARDATNIMAFLNDIDTKACSGAQRADIQLALEQYLSGLDRSKKDQRIQIFCSLLTVKTEESTKVRNALQAKLLAIDDEAFQLRERKKNPYIPLKHNHIVNLNGEVDALNRPTFKLACRHISAALVSHWRKNPKIDTYTLSDRKLLQRLGAPQPELLHQQLERSKAYLYETDRFGHLVCELWNDMDRAGEKERALLLQTSAHSMACQLRIKKNPTTQATEYVVKFYDPNRTNSHTRCAVETPSQLRQAHLRDFFPGKYATDYALYFEDSAPFMAFEPRAQADDSVVIGAQSITPAVLHLLLCDGRANAIRELTPALQTMPRKEVMAVLAAKDLHQYPGLFLAMRYGRSAAVQAYHALLTQLDTDPGEPAFHHLLEGQAPDTTPALFAALHWGHAEVIAAYGSLLKVLPSDVRLRLLAARDGMGYYGLAQAAVLGNIEAIYAYKALLQELTPDELDTVFSVMQPDLEAVQQEAEKPRPMIGLSAYQSVLALWRLAPEY